MMYNSNLAVAIKVNGKVLREFKDTVYIPFGSEYSIFIKNMNTRRVMVRVSIDGEDVLNGHKLIIDANSSIDLERFLKNLNKGNRFKFIERTPNIEKNRGLKAEDGLIRIEFAVEKETPSFDDWYKINPYKPYKPYVDPWVRPYTDPRYPMAPMGTHWTYCSTSVSSGDAVNSMHLIKANNAKFTTDIGITVPGSTSKQKFCMSEHFETGPSEVIIMRLIGDTGQAKVNQTITTKSKPICTTCKRSNKSSAKFCSECGTSLIVWV